MNKTIKKIPLSQHDQIKEDIAYWLSKTPSERLEAVEILRRQYYGNSDRLQRVVTVIERKKS